MSGPTGKLEKRYEIVNYCVRLLREWPTAIQELLPLLSEKGLSRRMTWKTLPTRSWNSPPTFFNIASSFIIISFTFFCKWSTFAWTINKKNLNRIFKALQNTLSHNYPIYIPAFQYAKRVSFLPRAVDIYKKMQNLIACCPVSISFLRNWQRESEEWVSPLISNDAGKVPRNKTVHLSTSCKNV